MDRVLVHAVIKGSSTALIEKIKKHCNMIGRDESIDSLLLAVREGRIGDPHLFLINAGTYFSVFNQDKTSSRNAALIANLRELRILKPNVRIVVLFPKNKENDIDLIDELLKLGIYDFYFLTEVLDEDIKTWLYTTKNINDVSKYLNNKEKREQYLINSKTAESAGDNKWEDPFEEEVIKKTKSKTVRTERVYTPYLVSKQIITVWGMDDSLLGHGIALLTAKRLAENGFKVALIEPIKEVPNLAETTGIRHKYYNTSHALSMYMEGRKEFLKHCLINKTRYRDDPNSPRNIPENVDDWPESLYFLPDIPKFLSYKGGLDEAWEQFISALLKDLVFQQGFDFVIHDVTGNNNIAHLTIDHSTQVFYVTNLHPANLAFAINQKQQRGEAFSIIGAQYIEFIAGEIEEDIIYPPASLHRELLKMIYLQETRLSEETAHFIARIAQRLGIMLESSTKSTGFLSKILRR